MKHRQDPEPETSDSPMDQTGIRDRAKEFIGTELLGISCKLIHPDSIALIWDEVEPHIARCTPHSEGELDTDDFFDYLVNAEMQLWVAVDKEIMAVMITQIIPYPKKKVLRIIAIAGEDMDRWFHFLPAIEEWAMELGCTSLEAWGRKGWLKVLQDWKCSYHILTKDLKGRMH